MIYLDYAATTPVKPSVQEVMARELAQVGNASSIHTAGRRARRVVEESREAVAELVGALPSEILFTSGGTEADNVAVKGIFQSRQTERQRDVVVVSNIEHPAVAESAQALVADGAEVFELPANHDGVVDASAAIELLLPVRDRTAVASIMWVNNELGTTQPVTELAAAFNEWGVPLHTDAVQAVAPIAIDFDAAGLAALTLSAHKIGGPQGVGALALARTVKCTPQTHGGGQERDIRSGTLSSALIAAFGEAARLAISERDEINRRVLALRDELEQRVTRLVPGLRVNGQASERIPGTSSLTIPGVDATALLIALDSLGVCCSAGSACAAGSLKPSKTLTAIGLSAADQYSTIRVSLGWASQPADVDAFIAAIEQAASRSQAVV